MANSTYRLPDGNIVRIDYGVCRNASTCSFTMADGRIVDAIYVPQYVICADCGKRYDSQIMPSHECPQQRRANARFARLGGKGK